MALYTTDGLIHLGNLLPGGNKTYSETGSTPLVRLGTMSFKNDLFGLRIFRYSRIMTAQTAGALVDRVALVTGTTDASTTGLNSTLSAYDSTNFTAGDEAGKVFQANVAGAAAPEGEIAYIDTNTASILSFDPIYPLSATLDTGDTYSDWSANHWDDAATDTNRVDVGGICMSAMTAKYYGWCQIYGYHPAVQLDVSLGAITANGAAVAGSLTAGIKVGETLQDYIGFFPQATSTNAVQAGMFIDVWHASQSIA